MSDIGLELQALVDATRDDLEAWEEDSGEEFLDAYVTVARRYTMADVVGPVTLLLGYGGPTIEAEVDDAGRLAVSGWWGSDRASAHGMASAALATYCEEFAYGLTAYED